MPRILIVEDEPDIARGLEADLRRNGFDVAWAPDGATALQRACRETWDVILLDVMLPKLDGFEVCRQLRLSQVRTPVIVLTAKVQENDKVMGLDLGADDYVTKPFSPRELRSRINAVLRRTGEEQSGIFRFGDLELDFDRAEVRRGGTTLDMTALELRILKAFVERRGRVLTRGQLIGAAWEPNTNVSDRVVDTHVLNLRKKIEPEPNHPRFIHGVRGIGYRFDG